MGSQPATVKMDTMTGRSWAEEESANRNRSRRRLDNEDDNAAAMLMQKDGDELDLEVNDWKPHFAKTRAVKWVDPVLQPRFDSPFRGNKDEEAPDTVSPKYDLVHRKEAFMVDISRQRGRFDEDENDRVAGDGDHGMPDDFAADAARARDEALERGVTAKSTSKRVSVVRMDKMGAERGLTGAIRKNEEQEDVDIDIYEKGAFVTTDASSYLMIYDLFCSAHI